VRLDVALRHGGRASILAEGRADNGEGVTVAALYLRLHPFPERAFDIQAGRIPPVFGAVARRTYGVDNPLIGTPLVYQYLTSLRSNSLPASADDLLGMRGRGWRTRYTIGSTAWDRGLPVIAGDRWDTGVEVRMANTSRAKRDGSSPPRRWASPTVRKRPGSTSNIRADTGWCARKRC
jgi:hypothetical protein